jgi:hypothetical protein
MNYQFYGKVLVSPRRALRKALQDYYLFKYQQFKEFRNFLCPLFKGSVNPFASNKDSNLLHPKTEEKRITVLTSMVNKSSLLDS